MVPFVDGWETNPIWFGGQEFEPELQFVLYFQGENLSEEYINGLDMYCVINGVRGEISLMLLSPVGNGFKAEMLSEQIVRYGEPWQLVIGEIVSGEMGVEGGHLQ